MSVSLPGVRRAGPSAVKGNSRVRAGGRGRIVSLYVKYGVWLAVWGVSPIVSILAPFVGLVLLAWLLSEGIGGPLPTALIGAGSFLAAVILAIGCFYLRRLANRKGDSLQAQARKRLRPNARLRVPPESIRVVGAERILFAQKVGGKRSQIVEQSAMMRARFVMMLTFLAGGLVWSVGRLLGTPSILVRLSLLPLLALGVGLLLAGEFRRWYPIWRNCNMLASRVGRKYRLCCVGTPQQIERIGELADVHFEPATFNVSWSPIALEHPGASLFFGLAALIAWAAATLIIWKTFALNMTTFLGPHLWLAPLVGYAATAVMRHTYIRIVPGRFEILQYPVFGRAHPYRRAIDLRSARVLVNLRRAYVRIQAGRQAGGSFEFSTALIPGERRLAYMLLLASISTHQPGPLPDDDEGGRIAHVD